LISNYTDDCTRFCGAGWCDAIGILGGFTLIFFVDSHIDIDVCVGTFNDVHDILHLI
jgi:hypothetical protein